MSHTLLSLRIPRGSDAGRIRRVVVAAFLASLSLAAWTSRSAAQTTYTWNRTGTQPWTTASNWTPSRNSPASNDILVINGSTTSNPTLSSLPANQTIGRLRIINNANVTFTATATSNITIQGGAAPNFEILAGSALTLSGTQAVKINIGSGATASIAGAMTVTGSGAHQLLGTTAGSIVFQNGSSFTTGSGYTASAFGTTGTADVVVFSNGSSYVHNAGASVFGLTEPASKVVFQTGSTAVYRTTSGYSSQGRIYANLTIQNNSAISGSGGANLTFGTLTVESGSSFTHSGSGTAVVTILGNLSSAGTGNVSITAGSGGVVFSGGVVQTVAGGGTGTVTLGSNATIASGTTLAVARTLTVSTGTLSVQGAFRIDQGGNTSGTNFSYGSSGTLIFNNSSGSFAVTSSSTFWPSASGPPNVTVQTGGGITMNAGANRTVTGTFSTAAAVTGANLLTLSGTVQMNTGGSFGAAPVYSGTATLIYAAGFTVGNEWTAGGAVGSGVPRNVTLQAASGTVSMPNSDRTVPGDLLITSGTLALNATSGNLFVGGNWTNSGTFTQNARTVTFNGTTTQTLTRTGGETFSRLVVDKSAGNLTLASGVTVNGTTSDVLQILNAGGIDLGGNTLTLSGAGGNLLVGGATAGTRTIAGTGTVAITGTKTVTNNNSRTLALDTNIRTTLASSVNFGAGLTTVRGILELLSGGSVATNAPSYASGSTLRYNTGGSIGRGVEWSATSGAGYPAKVEVIGNTVLDLGAGGASTARQLAENLTIATGSTLTMNNGGNAMTAALTALGNVTVDGTLTLSGVSGGNLVLSGNLAANGTLTANGRTLTFQGGGTQTASRTGGLTVSVLRLAKSAGSLQLLADVTCTGVLFDGTVDVLDLNGQTLTVNGTLGGTDAASTLRGSATSRLVLTGTGAAGTLRFAGGAQTLDQLTLSRTASGTVTLGTPLTVNGVLTLTDGTIVTGANTLTLGPSGSVTRTNGFVVGSLAKRAATGATALTFEIGSPLGYTPVSLQFANVSVAGDVTASTTDGDHSAIGTSGIDATHSVNRVYKLTATGVTFTTYSATFNFLAGDVDAGSVSANFGLRRYVNPNWSPVNRGTVTATSIQATGATGFGEFAIGQLQNRTITASTGANGTISPLGAVQVQDGSNLTFTMIPDQGYHVQNLLVDGASVGAPTSYTFTNVTVNHTIAVSFAIDVYTLTLGVSGEGSATKTPDQPSYVYGSFVNLVATPAEGWDFASWDAGDFTSTENPLYLRMDFSRTVTANFVRSPLKYVRSTFSDVYTPISVGGGATFLTSSEDSTRSIPVPFQFNYSGLTYTPANFLAINANGFMFLSRSSVTASLGAFSNNNNLVVSTTPNGTIAPWYDDISGMSVGTNPAGSILYQTEGSTGSRRLTVQWTDVSSFSNTLSGQPRRLNFQAVFYEGTNVIEFRYGPISGAQYSTFESASIGLEDSLGGNGLYLDGMTGSRSTFNGMMTTNKWPSRYLRFTPGVLAPLATGTYDVGVGRTYPSLSEAVADLNQRGVAGPVTLRLTDAVYDTSSSGGSNIFPIMLAKIAGSSSTNTITIQAAAGTPAIRYRGVESGNCGNASNANLISPSNEPIFALSGTDYVTLRNLSFEGGLMVDRGVLVVPTSTSDGAQFNTIQDVAVRLSRTNISATGIQQFVSTTPTGPAGTNSGNHYYNLNIANSYAGISLAGHSTVPDEDCEVGVTGGGASVIGGPTPGDLGGGTSQTFGIRATNQRNVRIFGNEVRNLSGNGGGGVDGILLDNLSTATFSSGVCEIFGNKVHGLDNSSGTAGRVTGIRANLSASAGSSSRIYNNFVYSLNSASTATGTRRIAGIFLQDVGGGSGSTHNVDFNSVRISPSSLSASNTCFEVGTVTGPVVKVRNNAFANFVGTQTGSGKHYCWATPGPGIGPAGSVSDRNVLHINNVANGFTAVIAISDKQLLSDWQVATGQDANSASSNPQYLSDQDLHINTTRPTPVESRAGYFGGAISWVPVDIDGGSRNPTEPDIGADEGSFNLLLLNDLAAGSVVDPAEGSMKIAGSSFVPQATIENAGTNNQTSFPVRFRILGPLPANTVVYDQTVTVASLSGGTSQAVTFPSATVATSGFYTTHVIVSLVSDQNHSNDQLTGTFENAGPLSGTYSVGAAQPPPYNSLTQAISRLNVVGVSGPVTFRLVDPSYGPGETFPININAYTGAGPSNRFTLKPAPGVVTSITGATTRAPIVLNGADYVTIDGSNATGGSTRDLTLTNTDPSTASAVVWGQTSAGNPTTNCVVANLVISGSGGTRTLFGVGFAGSTIGQGSGGVGNNNTTVDNCLVKKVKFGIYSSGFSSASKNSGTIISRNDINTPVPDNVTECGIQVRFENNIQITDNRIGDIVTSASESAYGIAMGMIIIASDQFVGDEVINATVMRNRIDHVESTHPDGLSAVGITIAPTNSGVNTIANNMIGRIMSPALDPDLNAGILVGGGAGTTRIYYNSVWMSGDRGNASSPTFALAIGGNNPAVDARDNIFINTQTTTGPGDSYVIGLNYETTYTNLTSNYNILWSNGPQFAVVGGLLNSPLGDQTNLAAWRSGTGKDGYSSSGNPLFASTSDLHIRQSGSPAANAGVVIPGITVDIDNETGGRATAPDIGADEYGSTYTLNVTTIGNGSVTKNPNQPNYISGDVVQLTAIPTPGYHLVAWSGDATGAANPLSVTMTANKNITATFAINAYTLNVTTAGSGTVTKSPNQATYNHGTAVTLTATPAAGYNFTGWSGDTTASTNPLSLVITANKAITANFALNNYTLGITLVGQGAVAKSPDQANYPHGSTVTLTATPAAGYHFLSWSGDASGATNPLTVTMTANKAITATFAINTYTLGITVAGQGAVAKNPDQPSYDHGTPVTLTATPATGYHFDGWSGDTTGTTNPLTLVVTGNRSITATFSINSYPVTLTTAGHGSATKSPDQPSYLHGSTLQLTATPSVGYGFVGWSGDAIGVDNPLSVVVDGPKNITALFTMDLTVNVVGNGTVAKSPNQPNYDPGSTVQLTATPNSGHSFVDWTGGATGTLNPISVTVDSDLVVTARFTTTLNVTTVGNGSVVKNPNQPNYNPDAVVQLTATPSANNHFVGWSGDATGSANPLSVTASSNKNITATFALDAYALNVTTVGSGTVAKSPNQPTYDHGSVVQLTPTPATGWTFTGWSGDTTGSANPLSVTMNGPKNITATFTINTYTLAVASGGNGTVTKNPNQATYNHGSVVTVTAAPDVGFNFVGWSGSATGSVNPLSVTMDGNKSITGTFATNTYTLGVTVAGSGSVGRSPDQASYNHGAAVTLTATPATGWHFVAWGGDTSGSTNPLSFNMTANKNITATFEINTYTLNVTASGSGTVAKNPNQPTYDHGTSVTLTPTPAVGFHFLSWSGDATGSANPLNLTMDANKNITATFAINTYTLNVTVSGSGTVAKSPNQATYDHGTVVNLTPTPAAGWHFVGWSGDASGSANPLSVTMNGNKNITASFAINTYTLTVNAGANGTVDKSPDLASYDHGTVVTVTATPATGYHLVGWSGDASGTQNPLFVTMGGNKNITATFAINNYTLDLTASGNGTVAKNPDQPTYVHGSTVTLTATPAANHHLANWSGAASGSTNPLTVTMDANKAITANFTIDTYALNVTNVGNGTVDKNPDQPAYGHGSTVLLSPSPAVGHHFVGWSGDASGSADPLMVTMNGPKSITATFAINTYTLSVSNIGNGSVAKNPDQPSYNHGVTVTLTAIPVAGWNFTGWSGDATGTANPLALVMDGNKAVTANYQFKQFTLDVANQGPGTVNRVPDQALYDYGTTVTLNAVPETGCHLVGWGGDASGTTNPLPMYMDANKLVNATFEINTYTLGVTVSGNGTVDRSPDQPLYNHGTTVQLTATPAPGYHLVGWSGDAGGSLNPINVTMDRDKDITATFAINTYSLTTSTVGNGTINRNPSGTIFDHGTIVRLYAIPTTGYHFLGWSGDAGGATTPLVVTMDRDKNIVGTFDINQYTLSVTGIGGGSVVKNPDLAAYNHGTSVQLTAVPDAGHNFRDWLGDASGTTSPTTVVMTGNRQVTARFQTNTYTLTVVPRGGTGTAVRSPNLPSYNPGQKVDLTFYPDSGYQFALWSWNDGRDTASVNSVSLTLDSNLVVDANLVPGGPPALATVVVGNGTVTRQPNQPSYPVGTFVTLTANPASGWRFVSWAGQRHVSGNPLQVFMDRDKMITATFESSVLTLDVTTALGAGSVTKAPSQSTYDYGTNVQLTAVPSAGYHFMEWGGDAAGTANPLTVTMDRNKSITASYGHVVNVTVVGTGTVLRSPDRATYAQGDTVRLTAQPGTRFHFTGWSGDTTRTAPWVTLTLNTDKNVTARFDVNTYALDTRAEGNGIVAKAPDQPTYEEGVSVQLQALPEVGWRFVEWSEDAAEQIVRHGRTIGCPSCLTGGDNPVQVVMTSYRSIVALFEPNQGGLVVVTQGKGKVYEVPPADPSEPVVRLKAVPNAGWRFEGWSGDVVSSENPLSVEAGKSARMVATFIEESPPDTLEPAVAKNPIPPPRPERFEFALVRLVPNPTSGRTQFEFTVANESHVRLSVIDAQGREVARLADGVHQPGRYVVSWDTRSGRTNVPAGLYFVRLRGPGKDLVRRLVVR